MLLIAHEYISITFTAAVISADDPGGFALCSFSVAGIAGSNPSGDMDVCL